MVGEFEKLGQFYTDCLEFKEKPVNFTPGKSIPDAPPPVDGFDGAWSSFLLENDSPRRARRNAGGILRQVVDYANIAVSAGDASRCCRFIPGIRAQSRRE